MLSTKHATLTIKILALLLVATVSFFFVSKWVPETDFVKSSLEQVEASSKIVMAFEATTLATSLAISALPEDYGSSYADALTSMNSFFLAILVILFFEKILVIFGVKFAFSFVIPIACILCAWAILVNMEKLKMFAAKLCILALAIALVVPCSTLITNIVAADLTAYVEETIADTDDGAEKLNQAMVGEDSDKTIFENLSNLFTTAINGVNDLMQYFQNMITKCMNAIAIMFLKTFVMPLMTFFFLKWILNETFNIMVPTPKLQVIQNTSTPLLKSKEEDEDEEKELLVIGG